MTQMCVVDIVAWSQTAVMLIGTVPCAQGRGEVVVVMILNKAVDGVKMCGVGHGTP